MAQYYSLIKVVDKNKLLELGVNIDEIFSEYNGACNPEDGCPFFYTTCKFDQDITKLDKALFECGVGKAERIIIA